MPTDTENVNGNGLRRMPIGRPFTLGNPGGPGRRPRSVEMDYLRATIASCPLDKWTKICERATAQAEQGDKAARAFLAKVLIGDDPLIIVQFNTELREMIERVEARERELVALQEELRHKLWQADMAAKPTAGVLTAESFPTPPEDGADSASPLWGDNDGE